MRDMVSQGSQGQGPPLFVSAQTGPFPIVVTPGIDGVVRSEWMLGWFDLTTSPPTWHPNEEAIQNGDLNR